MRPRWNYEKKIFLGLAIVVMAFLPLVGVSLYTIHKLIGDENSIIENNARQSLLVERLQFFYAAQSRQILLYILTKEQDQLDSYLEFRRHFHEVLDEMESLETDPPDLARLEILRRDSKKVDSYRDAGIRMIQIGETTKYVETFFQTTSAPLSHEIGQQAQQLAASAANDQREAHVLRDQTVGRLEEAIVLLSVIATILLIVVTFQLVKVSRQKRLADEQAARISEARKEIVEVVAHDVKSPIATIQMSLELLKENLADAPALTQIRSSLEIIERSAATVQKLITNLLDHAKIEAGHLVIDRRPTNLGQLVEDVVLRFKTLAQAKRLRLELDLTHDGRLSSCDANRIDQALSNLLGNAVKFTPEGGTIVCSCRQAGEEILISVKDSGPGLSSEQISHIFERYWQVKRSGRQGTGLGLAIVKSIVDAHHGRVWVESSPQKGTAFSIALPS